MKLLLDTHLLLWSAGSDERLSPEARHLIGASENDVIFSVVSLWEVAIKAGRGRDDFRGDFRADAGLLRRGLLDHGYHELPIAGEHALAVTMLPPFHKDPFDRMLVAQSVVEGILLLTADPVVARYPAPVRLV